MANNEENAMGVFEIEWNALFVESEPGCRDRHAV